MSISHGILPTDISNWPKGRLILAYLLKEAKTVDGKVKLNKLMAFLNLERNIDIGYKITDGPYGVVPKAMGPDMGYLLDNGYGKVKKTQIYTYSKTNFESTDKLNDLDIPLPEDIKKGVRSILREYLLLSNRELSEYSHERYSSEKYKKVRKVNVAEEIRENRNEERKMYMDRADGDERKALKMWIKEYGD